MLAIALFPLLASLTCLTSVFGAKATVFYDLTGTCGKEGDVTPPTGPNWSANENGGIPKCDGQRGLTYTQLASQQIVALDLSFFTGDFSGQCGKEVQVTKPDGTIFQFSGGPLYVWEGCPGCEGGARFDLSAAAFTDLNGGACGPNNPEGLTYQILDNYVVDPWDGLTPPGGTRGPAPDGLGSATASVAASNPAATSSAEPFDPNVSVSSTAVPGTLTVSTASPAVPSVPTTAVVPPVSPALDSVSAPYGASNSNTNTALPSDPVSFSAPVAPSNPPAPSAVSPSVAVAPGATTALSGRPGGWGNWRSNALVAADTQYDASGSSVCRRGKKKRLSPGH